VPFIDVLSLFGINHMGTNAASDQALAPLMTTDALEAH
jgi:hypothetical protein